MVSRVPPPSRSLAFLTVNSASDQPHAPAHPAYADIEPRNLQHHEIYRLLDLAATEEDQHEVRRLPLRPAARASSTPSTDR